VKRPFIVFRLMIKFTVVQSFVVLRSSQECGSGNDGSGCFLLSAEARPTKNYIFYFHLVWP